MNPKALVSRGTLTCISELHGGQSHARGDGEPEEGSGRPLGKPQLSGVSEWVDELGKAGSQGGGAAWTCGQSQSLSDSELWPRGLWGRSSRGPGWGGQWGALHMSARALWAVGNPAPGSHSGEAGAGAPPAGCGLLRGRRGLSTVSGLGGAGLGGHALFSDESHVETKFTDRVVQCLVARCTAQQLLVCPCSCAALATVSLRAFPSP